MLGELFIVSGWFEFITDEFQSNRVNISRVYVCIKFFEEKFSSTQGTFLSTYTEKIMKRQLESLNKISGS